VPQRLPKQSTTRTSIDRITFLNGTLYLNNVFSNNLYRIPVDTGGKAGQLVDIWMDQPVKGPDGMRAANGKLPPCREWQRQDFRYYCQWR
jgi:hypothetical protein